MDYSKILWFPFEESVEELLQKYLDREQEPPLFWIPGVMRGDRLEWLEKKIIEGRAKFDTRVIFIDHLHFIVPLSSERLDIRIGHTMRELKRMAKSWCVLIFIVAHMKQPRMLEQPTIDEIRDSSFIAQESDSVLMLWRKTQKVKGVVEITNEVNLSVQANRRTGKTGNVKLIFSNGKFLEQDWHHEEPITNGEW
jgi:replicative DNA helicase